MITLSLSQTIFYGLSGLGLLSHQVIQLAAAVGGIAGG
jgi:hypothetical protein